MKKCKLLFVPLFFLLLASCTNGGGNSGETTKPLNAPVLKVNNAKDGLIWDAIEGAKSYNITINDDIKNVTVPGYSFAKEAGSYRVSVVAVADDEKNNSESAKYDYETKLAVLGELSLNDGNITWASLTGLGVEAKFDNEEFVKVEDSSVKAEKNGTYTLHALSGFDENNKIFYVDSKDATKTIEVAQKTKLATPVLRLNDNRDGLVWDEISGATSYKIVSEEAGIMTLSFPEYYFELEEGTYNISVFAISDDEDYNSDPAEFSYEVKFTSLGELTLIEGEITWASFTGLSLQYKVDDGEFLDVLGDKIVADVDGTYTVKAKNGFDDEDNVFYVDDSSSVNTRTVTVNPKPLVDLLVMEDGSEETSADVKDKYEIFKYDNGWVKNNSADVSLSEENEGFTENKCVKIKYFKHSADFKYQQSDVKFPNPFDTVSFALKGNTDGSFKISIKADKETYIGDINIQGVYIAYTVQMPANWTRYSLSFDDTNWQVVYSERSMTFNEIKDIFAAKGYAFNSLGEVLPYFDSVSFLCKCPADANWSTAYAYLDDFQFANTGATASVIESITQKVSLKQNYVLKSDNIRARLSVGESSVLSFKQDETERNVPVTLTVNENNELSMSSNMEGYEFNATFTSDTGGTTFALKEVNGTIASLFANAVMESYQVLDDFESYTQTGIGYDSTHTPDQISGLRGAYFADFYSGSASTSPVGGPNWEIMRSTDYLELNKDLENVHSGNQSARFKYNSSNQMRYLTYGLSDGTATPITRGSTFSLWTKGVATRDNVIKVRLYTAPLIMKSNQDSDCVISTEYTIPMNADWTEIKFSIDPNKTFYGFGIYPMKGHGTGAYFYVDDISIYNTISPWGE